MGTLGQPGFPVKFVPDVEADHVSYDEVVGAQGEHPVQEALHAYAGLLYPGGPDDLQGWG